MPDSNKETLLATGFVDVGAWHQAGEGIVYKLDGERAPANALLMEQPNALYAFVRDEAVRYIGKTTQGVKSGFVGYRNPGKGQQTNLRCNAKIKEALKAGAEIRILVFTPVSDLRYREFEINLAAGLEDALIKAFQPPWNGSDKGKPITENAEREKAEETVDALPDDYAATCSPMFTSAPTLATFEITLGQAYYHHGFINPGKGVSSLLGPDSDPIQIAFEDGTDPVLSTINRKANPNGTVRIVGRNRQIAEWFQGHFHLGDVVQAKVVDPNHILLMSPKPGGTQAPADESPAPVGIRPVT
ncbi:MAG: nuclease family protein [Enterovirga sp.]|jgi:hypothetical protein|nr:nuclease family protein [Enterovirga sp.]